MQKGRQAEAGGCGGNGCSWTLGCFQLADPGARNLGFHFATFSGPAPKLFYVMGYYTLEPLGDFNPRTLVHAIRSFASLHSTALHLSSSLWWEKNAPERLSGFSSQNLAHAVWDLAAFRGPALELFFFVMGHYALQRLGCSRPSCACLLATTYCTAASVSV